jgi:ferredoxin
MPKDKNSKGSAGTDIFQLLMETSEKERKKRREDMLKPLGVKDFFVDGAITINKRTCRGVECKLCIKACPTNALFWKAGEVGITHDLCIYCGACVLSCIVDDCIRIWRRRQTGEIERFSTPRAVVRTQGIINAKKRFDRVEAIFPTSNEYLKKYKPSLAI